MSGQASNQKYCWRVFPDPGRVILDGDDDPGSRRRQVHWHNQDQEEVYLILEGEGEMCLGRQRYTLKAGQTISIPPHEYHQLTNRAKEPLKFIYCYGPAGDVAHWRQVLDGTLPKEVDAPPLPEGAWPQCTVPLEE